jgi:hypothetical protein
MKVMLAPVPLHLTTMLEPVLVLPDHILESVLCQPPHLLALHLSANVDIQLPLKVFAKLPLIAFQDSNVSLQNAKTQQPLELLASTIPNASPTSLDQLPNVSVLL